MSGTDIGPPPRTDAELARNLVRRSERLENPAAARMGDWVGSTGPNGELLFSNVNGGNVAVLTPPSAETDPDATVPISHDLPYVRVHRADTQGIFANIPTPVQWDTIDADVGGWGFPIAGSFTEVTVPKSGLYLFTLGIAFPSTTRKCDAIVVLDGVPVAHGSIPITGATGTGVTSTPSLRFPTVTDVRFLGAGSKIQGVGLTTVDLALGPDPDYPTVFTSMSIVCLRELALGAVTT